MSDSQKTAPSDDVSIQIPAYVPEDMIPVWLWFREKGVQWLVTIAVGVLVVVGVLLFRQHGEDQAALASTQLLKEPTQDTLEKTVADFGGTPAGVAAKLKLAKFFYDSGQYDKALTEYDDFIKRNASFPFVDVARVGRGFALCGLNRTAEALEVFRSFRDKNPGHYLTQQTLFGEATCLTQQGKKDAAKLLLQEVRAANRETAWDVAAKRLEGAIDRYQPHAAPRSLLDQANALAPVPK